MWLDAAALLILGVFIGMGALRGALASALGLVTLAAGDGAAVIAGPRLGPVVAERLDLAQMVGLAVAGMAAFLAVFVVMGIASWFLNRWARERAAFGRSARDRFLGGAFGAVRGALVVMLLSWLALWVDALRVTGTVADLPDLGPSRAAAVTSDLVESGVQAAVGDAPSGRLMARLASRPGAALGEVQALLDSPELAAQRSDAMFWTYVESGAVDAAMNRASFVRITRDASLRMRLAELGLIGEDAANDPRAFRDVSRQVLAEVGPRLRRVKNDPALQQLAEDPEIQAAIQSGDTVALMTHPRFRQLVSRVLEDETEGS